MKPKLFIVTGNPLKFKELSHTLNGFFDCEQKILSEPEIQGTPEEILKYKLARAYEVFKQPVLVDDVSFHFDELNGFPGPYMKSFVEHMTLQDMGVKFAGTRAKVSCRLGIYFSPEKIIIAEGKINGKIVVPEEKYKNNRYFDIFVIVDGTERPMVEYSTAEKNEFSHRGMAMKNLLKILEEEKIN